MIVRKADFEDSVQIAEIYNYYIENSHATFEVEILSSSEMENRIRETFAGKYPFFICEESDEIIGYAYGRQFRPRRAYLHTVETSVYIKNGWHGKSIGTMLYEKLFEEIFKMDIHAIIGGISLPNEASVKLHEKFGFEKVAHFREVGFKFGQWIDVGYWELLTKNKK